MKYESLATLFIGIILGMTIGLISCGRIDRPIERPIEKPMEPPNRHKPTVQYNKCASVHRIMKRSNLTGTQIIAHLKSLPVYERDNYILSMVQKGNMPSFMRKPIAITMGEKTICTFPDYFALGNDKDYVRMPVGAPLAYRIAKEFRMELPTKQIVDAIYQAADIKLTPKPMKPTNQMSSIDYYVRHDFTLDGQLNSRIGLIVGHKKDIIQTQKTGRVTIYGWHWISGNPIQPVSSVHGKHYFDYSHGLRLVKEVK